MCVRAGDPAAPSLLSTVTVNESPQHPMTDLFRRVACRSAEALGSSWAFIAAAAVVVVWAASGPFFGFSDTWQLVINTGTTVVTFLMVFLIQNAQNRDAKALHLKLDELIHAVKEARNELIDVEDLNDEELARLQREFQRLREEPAAPGDATNAGESETSETDANAMNAGSTNGHRTRKLA
jgi:low affinity Fe/Cu permease